MNIINFIKQHSQIFDINKLQDNIVNLVQQINKIPIVGGLIVKDQSLSTGNNVIQHKLGKIPAGYIIIDQTAAVDIYRVTKTDKTITLNTSGNVTISLYIF